jgi:hypothetical protein
MNKKTGLILATAVAGLVLAGPAIAGEGHGGQAGQVKCMGANSCKGTGKCGVSDKHNCAGKNECKGKGWIYLSKEDCAKKGGKSL